MLYYSVLRYFFYLKFGYMDYLFVDNFLFLNQIIRASRLFPHGSFCHSQISLFMQLNNISSTGTG